jgi:hypothetical protein
MKFNRHPELEGRHAYLSASKHHWTNYDEEKFERTYFNALAAAKGTAIHEYAARAIKLGMKQPRNNKTVCMYINDAIGYKMEPEQVLMYSPNAFGTADAISFRNNVLRIHDLKTGTTPSSFRQLEIYCAFFCLEYDVDPHTIEMFLRIYKNDDTLEHVADPVVVQNIMLHTIKCDEKITEIQREVLL